MWRARLTSAHPVMSTPLLWSADRSASGVVKSPSFPGSACSTSRPGCRGLAGSPLGWLPCARSAAPDVLEGIPALRQQRAVTGPSWVVFFFFFPLFSCLKLWNQLSSIRSSFSCSWRMILETTVGGWEGGWGPGGGAGGEAGDGAGALPRSEMEKYVLSR